MLNVQNIIKYYDKNKISEQCVLKNISLTLPDTGLISIFGPSGSGKTTLLNILAGLDTPTTGTVLYNETPVTDDFRYNNVGVIFQDYALLENRTVEENIRIGYLDVTNEMLEDTLKALDILRLKDRRVSMLSGGEKQRVSIARAIIKKPAYIIADEPTGNLDLKNRMRVMQILKSLSTHMLVILVSHDIELVTKYSDRIITLNDGEITHNKIIVDKPEKIDYEIKQDKHKFNLAYYLKDKFKMRKKTNFIILLFMIISTLLICFLSANITGYKYKSSNLTNNYITFKENLPLETFEEIQDKGHFQFEIDVKELYLPSNNFFNLNTPVSILYLKNTTIKLYPYQNEEVLYSRKTDADSNSGYLTKKLATRLLQEGRIRGGSTHDGFTTPQKLYIQNIEDLLGFELYLNCAMFEIVGIVDSEKEGILYDIDSYYAFSPVRNRANTTLPYHIFKKYYPQATPIEQGKVLLLGYKEEPSSPIDGLGYKNTYIVQDLMPESLTIGDATIHYVINDYDYYEESGASLFYTANLDEVTSILDKNGISYTLDYIEYNKEIDEASKNLTIIFLSIAFTLLLFCLFFTLLDASNYIHEQLSDIIILRNMGITKGQVIHTYTFKLLLKISPSYILGFLVSIFCTYHLKSFNYQTSFMFQINGITLLLSFILGIIVLSASIYIFLIKKFSPTAATLKMKNKI